MEKTLIALRIPNDWLERIDAEGPRRRSKVILKAVDQYLNTEEIKNVVDVPAVVVAENQEIGKRTCPIHGHIQGFVKGGGWWCISCGKTY